MLNLIPPRLWAWGALACVIAGLGMCAHANGVRADRLHAEIHAPVDGWVARLEAANRDRDGWTAANARCEALRRTEAGAAADLVAEAADGRARASAGAFEQGYAAGRAVGRRSCTGGTDAKTADDAGDPVGDLVERVRHDGDDFAAAWKRGAYQPGGAVPAGDGRAVDRRAPPA